MMVARHEMPGKQAETIRPVGHGMIRDFQHYPTPKTMEREVQPDHTVPSGTGFSMARFQAFHAWLPSLGPSGTGQIGHYGDATMSPWPGNTPILPHSITLLARIREQSAERRTPNAKRRTPTPHDD
jgi:hypothetical protein